MRLKVVTIAALLVFYADVVFAQWEGGFKGDGSWNFEKNNSENADFKLKYKEDKISFGTNLFFNRSYLPSTQITSILDAKNEQDKFYKGEGKSIQPTKLNMGINLDLDCRFNQANTLNASVGYSYATTAETSELKSERYDLANTNPLNGIQNDTALLRIHKINSSVVYKHKFNDRPNAGLDISLSGIIGLNADKNRRVIAGDFYAKPKNYATYSSFNDFNSIFSASYDDVYDFEKSRLTLKAGLDFISNQDLDRYSAETFFNGHWTDSADYRQSYFYNSFSTEPYVNLNYSIGKYNFFVRERLQWFWHAVIDKLDEKEGSLEDLTGLFDKHDVKNILNAGVSYRISGEHDVTLDYGRSISRPDYQKLCPTLMIGKSDGEYFIGNPELKPETIDKVNIRYTYKKGKFVTTLDVNYSNKRNTAEKVIDLDKMNDVANQGVRTLYTWINNKNHDSFGSRLTLKMSENDIKAEIWAGYNYDSYSNNKEITKTDSNYELGTNITTSLNEKTNLSYSLVYVSVKQSAYNLKGEDVLANLRFTRNLSKGLDLYAEVKDIVDKDVYEETWNAQRNYLKTSTTVPKHRALLIGINYIF